MQLRKRSGGVWHARFYVDGERIERTTHCTDKKAAEALARQWERDAADPDHAAQDKATVEDALGLLLTSRASDAKAGRRSHDTVNFYRSKSGHVNRLLGAMRLRRLNASHVDAYIRARRDEGAAESTIHKELVALRASLKLAKRARIWRGDPADVCPIAFAPEYKPRERALSLDEVQLLLRVLPEDRGAQVAFMVATGAEWGAVERAQRDDVVRGPNSAVVLVRGTKRASRWRHVPVVTPLGLHMLDFATSKAEGAKPLLFTRWPNVRRDLRSACAKAGCLRSGCPSPSPDCTRVECRELRLAPCSPNDLRRTFATWLRMGGATPDVIAPAMGHVDSRMVERVYGRLSPNDLAARLAAQLGVAPPVPQTPTHSADTVDRRAVGGPRNHAVSVPRDGIEPPTRGFSSLVPLLVSSGNRRRKSTVQASRAPAVPQRVVTKPRTKSR